MSNDENPASAENLITETQRKTGRFTAKGAKDAKEF